LHSAKEYSQNSMDNRLGILYTKAQSQHQINARHRAPVYFERPLSEGLEERRFKP
jgi:hypothetical protein